MLTNTNPKGTEVFPTNSQQNADADMARLEKPAQRRRYIQAREIGRSSLTGQAGNDATWTAFKAFDPKLTHRLQTQYQAGLADRRQALQEARS